MPSAAVAISIVAATTVAWMSGRITNEWIPVLVYICLALPVSPEVLLRRFVGTSETERDRR